MFNLAFTMVKLNSVAKIEKEVYDAADFMKIVPSVYTHSMKTIYLSLSAHVAEGTIFRKSPVTRESFLILIH